MKYHTDTNVLAKRIDEETVLVHLDSDRVLHTNATGSRIWELLTEGHSDSEIIALLGKEYQRAQGQIEEEVRGFVEQLIEEGLVARTPE